MYRNLLLIVFLITGSQAFSQPKDSLYDKFILSTIQDTVRFPKNRDVIIFLESKLDSLQYSHPDPPRMYVIYQFLIASYIQEAPVYISSALKHYPNLEKVASKVDISENEKAILNYVKGLILDKAINLNAEFTYDIKRVAKDLITYFTDNIENPSIQLDSKENLFYYSTLLNNRYETVPFNSYWKPYSLYLKKTNTPKGKLYFLTVHSSIFDNKQLAPEVRDSLYNLLKSEIRHSNNFNDYRTLYLAILKSQYYIREEKQIELEFIPEISKYIDTTFGNDSYEAFDFIVNLASGSLIRRGLIGSARNALEQCYQLMGSGRLMISDYEFAKTLFLLSKCFDQINEKNLIQNNLEFAEKLITGKTKTFSEKSLLSDLRLSLFHFFKNSSTDTAVHYIKKCMLIQDELHKQYNFEPSAYFEYGSFLLAEKEFDSAFYYFTKQQQYLKSENKYSQVTWHLCAFRLGETMYLKGDVEKGMARMSDAINSLESGKLEMLRTAGKNQNIFLHYALHLNTQGEFNTADKYLKMHLAHLESTLFNGFLTSDFSTQYTSSSSYKIVNDHIFTALRKRSKNGSTKISVKLCDILFLKNSIMQFQKASRQFINDNFHKDEDYKEFFNEYLKEKELLKLYERVILNVPKVDSIYKNLQWMRRQMMALADDQSFKFSIEGITSVIPQLQRDEVFLDIYKFTNEELYATASGKTYAFLILNSESVDSADVIFASANEIDSAIQKHRFTAFSNERGNTSTITVKTRNSNDLNTILPTYAVLRKYTKWNVINDGLYDDINIAGLKLANSLYVVDSFQVKYYSSPSDFIQKDVNHDKSVTVIGNPAFSYSNEYSVVTKDPATRFYDKPITLQPLPGSKTEIDSIRHIFTNYNWHVKYFSDATATGANFMNNNKSTVVHIATHGFYDQSFSYDVFGRSGFYLAGSEDLINYHKTFNQERKVEFYKNQPIITGFDMMDCNLSNVLLYNISACESGLGDGKVGEGTWGLQQALKMAGVKYLLYSTTNIDDQVTSEFMKVFYSKFVSGDKIEDAFYSAQKSIRKKHSEPYYWAPFVLCK